MAGGRFFSPCSSFCPCAGGQRLGLVRCTRQRLAAGWARRGRARVRRAHRADGGGGGGCSCGPQATLAPVAAGPSAARTAATGSNSNFCSSLLQNPCQRPSGQHPPAACTLHTQERSPVTPQLHTAVPKSGQRRRGCYAPACSCRCAFYGPFIAICARSRCTCKLRSCVGLQRLSETSCQGACALGMAAVIGGDPSKVFCTAMLSRPTTACTSPGWVRRWTCWATSRSSRRVVDALSRASAETRFTSQHSASPGWLRSRVLAA